MNQINIDLNIRAFTKLYEYCSDRRHHLVHKTERGNDDVWERAEVINKNIKTLYNIDAFNIEDESKYIDYESSLSKYILDFNHKYILKGRNIDDEVSLILGAKDYPVGRFKNKNLEGIEGFAISDEHKLSMRRINNLIQNTIKVQVYQEKESDIENYFVTSKMNYKNLDRIFLIHAKGAELIKDRVVGQSYNFLLTPLSRQEVTNVVKKNDNKLVITSIMILKEKDYLQHLDSPIVLFLELLDRYGVDIKVDNKIKRFYKKFDYKKVNELLEKDEYTYAPFESYEEITSLQIKDKHFKNFYALDLKRHGYDISKGRI